MKPNDTYYMAKAIELAEKGRGTTSPNPMVGAVIVNNRPHTRIIGQGYHKKAGSDHAEIVALKEAGEAANGATLYVSLEPCCHYGKTPPCTDAIIKSGIKRVVAAMIDDNPLVNGKSIRILRDAGIETSTGILEHRARKLNEAYLKFITTGMPFVTVKMAITLDGKIADIRGISSGKSWISSAGARKRVQEWRSWSDAVMVGAGTVIADNPRLTVRTPPDEAQRDGSVENSDSSCSASGAAGPLRVVVDSTLKIPTDAHVFDDRNVLIATTEKCDETKATELEYRSIETRKFISHKGRVPLGNLLKELGARKITSVLCEGGAELITTLIRERLADKFIFVVAPKLLGSGRTVIDDIGIRDIGSALTLKDVTIEVIEHDTIITGYPNWEL